MDSDLVTINNQLNFEIRCIDTKMKKIQLKYKLEKDKNKNLINQISILTENMKCHLLIFQNFSSSNFRLKNYEVNRQTEIFNFRSTYFAFFFIIVLIVYFFTRF